MAYYNRLKNTIEFISDSAIKKIMEKGLGSVIHYAKYEFTLEHEDSVFEILLSEKITKFSYYTNIGAGIYLHYSKHIKPMW